MIEVSVTLGGGEVAKWVANLGDGLRNYHNEDFFIASANPTVYRDLDDQLGLPTLGEDIYVEIRVRGNLASDIKDPYRLPAHLYAYRAIRLLLKHKVPVDRADRLEVRVNKA